MKQWKRLTSVLLVLGMVLGLMPLSAFAAEPAKKPFTEFTEVVDGNTYTYMPLDDDTVELTGFDPKATAANVVIPSTATSDGKKYSVTSIGTDAFSWCTALTTVNLGNSVVSIGTGAFGMCTALTTVNFGNSVDSIGDSAFAYCTSLESVTLPDSIVSIGAGAFSSCTQLDSVTIPSRVQTIGHSAFDYGILSSKTKLGELHYTGTKAQWDELMNKEISYTDDEGSHTGSTRDLNPMLKNPENFDYAHTVSFDYGGKAEGTSKVVEYEGTVTPPDDPTADGYQFEGWYTQKNGGELFNFTQPIKEDVTVYAHWSEVKPDRTVYFDCGNQAAESTKVVVQHGEKVTPPADPKADGYRFEGWYTQENGGEPFDFNQEITEDVKVYAHWSKVETNHTVYFNCGGKAEGSTKVVQYGEKVTPPANPTADGYQFEGWYTQENGGVPFDFEQDITKDVTVYAHWSEVKPDRTVYFDCGSQAKGFSMVVQYEGTVTQPADPKADGYRFEGWYTQENGDEKFDFRQPIKEDVTVYAHWSEVKPEPNPEPNPEPTPEPTPTPTPTPDPDTDTAKEYTLTEKDGSLVRVTVEENGATVDITKNVVLQKQGTTQIGKIPAGAMVTVAANAAPEGMVFAQWNISDPALMGDPDVVHTSQTMTFPMPQADVTVEAMYESAENARETELLGSAAMIGAVGISAVVLAYQAHQLGTELYLRYLLPSGAALPQNRIQLAELLWRNAGEPVPDVNAMYEDIDLNEEAAQQAAQWALENELMELPDEEHTGQFKPDEQISYGEAIRAWKKAQQLKTAE